MFTGLTAGTCESALTLIKPVLDLGAFKRTDGELIVLNPNVPYTREYASLEKRIAAGDEEALKFFWDEVVLKSWEFGERSGWEHPYDRVAASKAFISWRTGLPSHMVQQLYPYLYNEGDTKWGGSAVLPGGLVIAFSGAEWYYDQMISEMMGSSIKAVCLGGMKPVLEDDKITFLGTRAT